MEKIVPVILSGGSGERLWPLSRKNYPKQFLNLLGTDTLFQQAVTRFETEAAPIVVTRDQYRFITRQQLNEVKKDNAVVIIEPEGKNTAPAILVAACHLAVQNPDAVMLIMPSDHHIPAVEEFRNVVLSAHSKIKDKQIICFGLKPTRPETGYGYIAVENINHSVMPVTAFTEKPDFETATKFIKNGKYFWNSGIFMVKVADIINIANELQPAMLSAVDAAYHKSTLDLDFVRLDSTAWAAVPGKSFDYAIMEKTSEIGCISFDTSWSDLGDWHSVAQEKKTDSSGNVLHGMTHQIESENCLFWSEKDGQLIAGIGLQNIMVISTGDATLVVERSRTQEVRDLVNELKFKSMAQVIDQERENRPWGWFERIAKGENFQAKLLHVDPGKQLSLQSHFYRSEHWVVVSGVATVVRNDEMIRLKTNESIYIHVGCKHQLINEGKDDLKILEVQTGSYFGEDDIVRHSDVHNRS
jgi:mannose-1-phosphate guanylyltransferase/mannose-6-phosphate isomerase